MQTEHSFCFALDESTLREALIFRLVGTLICRLTETVIDISTHL